MSTNQPLEKSRRVSDRPWNLVGWLESDSSIFYWFVANDAASIPELDSSESKLSHQQSNIRCGHGLIAISMKIG